MTAIWCALVVLLLGTAMWIRWDSGVFRDDEIRLEDPDTLRRLARLHALDVAETYPVIEQKDGYPSGSISHWTLPMDWVIRALDPIASLMWKQGRPYEAGAAIASSVLGLVSVGVMLLGALRLFGPIASLAIATAYAFSFATIDTTYVGNADHQSLQHLLLLGSVLLGLLALQERRAGFATASGVLSGAAVWVTTESMLLVYVIVGIVAALTLFERERQPWADRARLGWSGGFVVVLLLGHVVEQRGAVFAFEYDKVSWFQLWQGLVVFGFAALVRWLPLTSWKRGCAAGGVAVLVGLAPMLVPAVASAFDAEVARMAKIDPWLRNEVVEFWGVFANGASFGHLFAIESPLVLALPVLLVGVWMMPRLGAGTRAAIITLAVATFGLEIWEQKLAQLFAMFFPLVVVCGGIGLVTRFAKRKTAALAVACGLALATIPPLPTPPSQRDNGPTYADWKDLCQRLRAAAKRAAPGAVLAPWSLGAFLMYHADLPVVASNYHRNIDGIIAGHRTFLARAGTREVQELLAARHVRFIVATYDPLFLLYGARTIGREPLATQTDRGFEVSAKGLATFYYSLRDASALRGLRLIGEGRLVPVGGRVEPIYRIWEVTR